MAEWIIGLVEQHGDAAIVALMVFENLFPPVPCERVMPFAGFVAARGTLHPLGVVGAGTLGSLLGMLPWYLLGRRIGLARMERWTRRHGRWLACSAAGIVVWVAALTAVGHTLGARHGEALHVLNPMAQVLLAFAVALNVWWLVRLRHG